MTRNSMTYSFDHTADLYEKRAPRRKLESNLIPDYLQRKALEAHGKGKTVNF